MAQVFGRRLPVRFIHTAIIVLAIVPAAWIGLDAVRDRLGPNPIEVITHRTGDWTIRLLLATLAISPLRHLTGWNELIRYRRTLGLLTFSYATLHFLIYLVIDQGFPIQGFAIRYVWKDIAKRPYITVGFTAFLLLIPLAWTSTKGWIRRLGRRWTTLHQAIYVAAALATLHFLWLVKGKQMKPVYYALVLKVLLSLRVILRRRTPRLTTTLPPPGATPGASPPPPLQPARATGPS